MLKQKSRVVICQKQISVEGDGHCCHRPSSNWETNQPHKQFRLCDSSSIILYAAELTAIKEVFCWISENETQDLKNFAIFSDSLSVLVSIKHSFSESRL